MVVFPKTVQQVQAEVEAGMGALEVVELAMHAFQEVGARHLYLDMHIVMELIVLVALKAQEAHQRYYIKEQELSILFLSSQDQP